MVQNGEDLHSICSAWASGREKVLFSIHLTRMYLHALHLQVQFIQALRHDVPSKSLTHSAWKRLLVFAMHVGCFGRDIASLPTRIRTGT